MALHRKTCLILLFMFLFFAVSLGGCAKKEAKSIQSPDQLAKQLMDELNMGEMVKVDEKGLEAQYSLTPDLYDNATAYFSKVEESSDQIVIFQFKSGKINKKIVDEISNQLSLVANNYKEQSPIEYKKISNVVIRSLDDKIVVIICNQYALAGEIIDKMGAKQIGEII